MVYSIRIAIFAIKRQIDKKIHFLQVTHFSLSNSCKTDQTTQRELENHKIQIFLNMLASMAGRWV